MLLQSNLVTFVTLVMWVRINVVNVAIACMFSVALLKAERRKDMVNRSYVLSANTNKIVKILKTAR